MGDQYWYTGLEDKHLASLIEEAINESDSYSTEELLGLVEDLVSAIRRLADKLDKLQQEKNPQ